MTRLHGRLALCNVDWDRISAADIFGELSPRALTRCPCLVHHPTSRLSSPYYVSLHANHTPPLATKRSPLNPSLHNFRQPFLCIHPHPALIAYVLQTIQQYCAMHIYANAENLTHVYTHVLTRTKCWPTPSSHPRALSTLSRCYPATLGCSRWLKRIDRCVAQSGAGKGSLCPA